MTISICSNGETHTVCDVCSMCRECGRKLNATPHVYVCACSEPHDIDLCPECRTKETAFQLTRTTGDGDHFWSVGPSERTPEGGKR